MKTTQKQINDSKIEIIFEFDKSDVEPQMEKATQNLSANVKIDGFREGKVPADIIKKTVGEINLYDEALKLTIQNAYPEYAEKNNLWVITPPEVVITKFVPDGVSECKVTVEVIPNLNLKGYKEKAKEALKDKKEVGVEDKEVEDTINWILESRSSFKELDRETIDNDIVEVNYDVVVDGKNQEDLKALDYKFVISKEKSFPELNKETIGMKKGETKDIDVTFGKDFFVEALRGKKGIIKLTLNKILQREIPELTDDFVKKLGKFENVSSFKDNIKNGILEEKKMKEEERIRLNILENIRKDVKIEVPEVLVNKEIERMIGEVKYKIANMGMEFEEYLKQIKKTEEDIKKDMYEDAKQKVLNILILREIIDLEKISVSEKEIQEKSQQIINDISYQNPNAKDIDMNTVNNYSEEILKNEKVFNVLMNQ